MKICSKCGGAPKPLTEFNKNASNRDGLQFQCRECAKETNAKYRIANRDKLRMSSAKYRADNADKVKKANAKRDAKRHLANPEKHRAAAAKWAAENPVTRRISLQNRRARKRAAGGKLSKDIAEKLFKLQRGKCTCGCGQPLGTDYHLDHIMPIALGGTNTDENIQLLRAKCNQQKYAKHPIDFMQQRGFLV